MTNWTITTLDRDVATGYVNCAHWTATATDGTYTSSIYSTCPIVYNPNEQYIPYANLTQAEVLAWIYENGVDQTATQTALDGMIESQINPTVVTPALPWSA